MKGSVYKNQLQKLIFKGIAIPGIADDAADSRLSHLHVAFHSEDPGPGGDQTTAEIEYEGYARVAVPRVQDPGVGFVVSENSVSPAQDLDFPEGREGPGGFATYFSIGTAEAGAGDILHIGELKRRVAFGDGIVPRLKASTAITED